MENKIEIFRTTDNQTEISVKFDMDTVWLNRNQLVTLFGRDVKTIGKHINNVFNEGELDEESTVAKFATVQKEGNREVNREIEHYNFTIFIANSKTEEAETVKKLVISILNRNKQ